MTLRNAITYLQLKVEFTGIAVYGNSLGISAIMFCRRCSQIFDRNLIHLQQSKTDELHVFIRAIHLARW